MRLFVALDLPEEVRLELHSWAARIEGSSWRLIDPESLHATLLFLGESEPVPLPPPGPAPRLRLARARRTPRFLAVSLDDLDGTLARLYDEVIRSAGVEPPSRPLWPHVTVARPVGRYRHSPLPKLPNLAFEGTAVALYRSHLGRGPARYEALERREFG